MLKNTRLTSVLSVSGLFLLLVFLASSLLSARYLYRSEASLKNLNSEITASLAVANTTNWMRIARTALLAAVPHASDGNSQAFDTALQEARWRYEGALKMMVAYQAAPKLPGEQGAARELAARYADYTQC